MSEVIEETKGEAWGPLPKVREVLESILRDNSTLDSIVEDTNIRPEEVVEILKALQHSALIDTIGQGVSITRGGRQALMRRTRYG